MAFDIREHLDRLEILEEIPSQYTCSCPACGGKLMINRERGAYYCFTGECPPKEIRTAMGLSFTTSSDYTPQKYIRSVPIKQFEAVPLVQGDLKENMITRSYYSVKYQELIKETVFYYKKSLVVKRIDKEDGSKVFFPAYYTEESNQWTYAKKEEYPFYQESQLRRLNKEGRFLPYIFIVEGEKCAYQFTKSTGYLALSPPGHGWTAKWLEKHIKSLRWLVKGYRVLPDNDAPGLKKAVLFANAAWELGIPCDIVKPDYTDCEKGEDVVDLISQGKFRVEEFLK